jgi:hypothetical protein
VKDPFVEDRNIADGGARHLASRRHRARLRAVVDERILRVSWNHHPEVPAGIVGPARRHVDERLIVQHEAESPQAGRRCMARGAVGFSNGKRLRSDRIAWIHARPAVVEHHRERHEQRRDVAAVGIGAKDGIARRVNVSRIGLRSIARRNIVDAGRIPARGAGVEVLACSDGHRKANTHEQGSVAVHGPPAGRQAGFGHHVLCFARAQNAPLTDANAPEGVGCMSNRTDAAWAGGFSSEAPGRK